MGGCGSFSFFFVVLLFFIFDRLDFPCLLVFLAILYEIAGVLFLLRS
jgi:hypothetical protein